MDSVQAGHVGNEGDDAGRLGGPWPSKRAQQKAEQKARTRVRLLEAAIDVYVDEGPANASLASVAARAGVSNATLFFHFGSRLDLMDELVHHLIETRFASEPDRRSEGGLRSLMEGLLEAQERVEVRLLWQLGDLIQIERSDGPNAAYWGLMLETERRLRGEGHSREAARRLPIVLAPALMLVARRVAFGLATEVEVDDFVAEACDIASRLGERPAEADD